MARYTIGDVEIDGAYPVERISELSMDIGVNSHGSLTYGGLIPKEAAEQYIRQSAARQIVAVSLLGECEFRGYPQEVSVSYNGDHCYLRVALVTSSKLIDIYPRSRFFQDTAATFEDMLAEAFEDSKTGNVVAVRGKEEIGKPILQYLETDWQFLLRMASRLGTVIVPNAASAEPQLALGVPARGAMAESGIGAYSVMRSFINNGGNSQTQNALCYEMNSENRYRLGDSALVNDRVLTVMRKSLAYEKGVIQELYVFGSEQGFALPYSNSKRIAGLELEGVVVSRNGQFVKILLDIDAGRSDCGKTWFGFSPVTNNGMYSMPLEGEKAMLQWQSGADDDALVVRAARKNSGDAFVPGERHFLTEYDQHLMMVPGKVEYANPAGSMKWLAGEGLSISTGRSIRINAGKDVAIESQAQVQVYSPERISLLKSGTESSIDMISRGLHIKAAEDVIVNSKANNFRSTMLPERSQGFAIIAAIASKLRSAIPLISNAKPNPVMQLLTGGEPQLPQAPASASAAESLSNAGVAPVEIKDKPYESATIKYAGTDVPARLIDGEYYVSIYSLQQFSPSVRISSTSLSPIVGISYQSASSFHNYGFNLTANLAAGSISGTAIKSIRGTMNSTADLSYQSDGLPYVSLEYFEKILSESGLRDNGDWDLPPLVPPPPIDRIRADRASIRTWDDEQIGRAMTSWIPVPIWKIDSSGEKFSSTANIGVHKELTQQVTQIFQEIYNHSSKFPIDEVGAWRWLRGTDFWTQIAIDDAIKNDRMPGNHGDVRYPNHPSGTAIDINPKSNPINAPQIEDIFKLEPDGIVVQTFKKYGWYWGGDWIRYKDWMHFSLLGG